MVEEQLRFLVLGINQAVVEFVRGDSLPRTKKNFRVDGSIHMNNLRYQVFLRDAINIRNQKLETFGVPTLAIVEKQKDFLPFLNVPWALRLCVDAMITKGEIISKTRADKEVSLLREYFESQEITSKSKRFVNKLTEVAFLFYSLNFGRSSPRTRFI